MKDAGMSAHSDHETSRHSKVASLVEILRLLGARWRLLLAAPLLVGLLTLAGTFLMTPLFTATTVILPASPQQNSATALLNSLGGMAAAMGAGVGKNSLEQWVGLLKSRTVADALIAEHQLKGRYEVDYQFQARDTLKAYTDIVQGKDGLIKIAVSDPDPVMAQKLANGYVTELQKLSWALMASEAGQRRAFFEAQLKDAKDKLTKAEFELQSGGFSEQIIKNSPQALIEVVARLKAQVTAVQVRLDTMKGSMTPDNPSLRQATRELESLKAQLLAAQASERKESMESKANLTYVSRLRDFKYYETLFELLARQYELAKSDELRSVSSVQMVDPAVTPEWKSSPQRAVIAALTALLALVLMMAFVILKESIRTETSQNGQ